MLPSVLPSVLVAADVYWLLLLRTGCPVSLCLQTMDEQCIDTVRPLELELHFSGEW